MMKVRSADAESDTATLVARSPSMLDTTSNMSDEEFETIRGRFGDPRANTHKEDYYGFRMIASGDGLDSYYTRQDLETSFPNFVTDLKRGQALLGSHQMATFAYGSSYDGTVIPADPNRSEYEPTFYPRWDRPELRTANWLVGKYFIPRGVELNGQKTDDLIRGIELGSQRKASISFVVGRYVCGIDGRDLVQGWFGPEPDEECSHFPGVAYGDSVAWALMKDNTLLETSLVYKNASPSSMLLRKAEVMATRGALSANDLVKIEERFQVRLPAFERRLWAAPINTTEEESMTRRSKGDDATREIVREALATEVDDDAESPAPEAEVVATAVLESDGSNSVTITTEGLDDVSAAAETEIQTEAPATETIEAESVEEPIAEIEHVAESVSEVAEEVVAEAAQDEDPVSEFIASADRFAAILARTPDAFDSGQLAMAARAERAIDLALIDAGCDTTVGSHVARTFETRARAIRETLGEPITVEAVRSLQQRASLGDVLFAELVKNAVAARTSVQGESFNAAKYSDVLIGTRDVSFVKEEIESWRTAKAERFTPGRQTVAPQPPADKTTKEERKSLPTRPVEPKALSAGFSAGSILSPRNKN